MRISPSGSGARSSALAENLVLLESSFRANREEAASPLGEAGEARHENWVRQFTTNCAGRRVIEFGYNLDESRDVPMSSAAVSRRARLRVHSGDGNG